MDDGFLIVPNVSFARRVTYSPLGEDMTDM